MYKTVQICTYCKQCLLSFCYCDFGVLNNSNPKKMKTNETRNLLQKKAGLAFMAMLGYRPGEVGEFVRSLVREAVIIIRDECHQPVCETKMSYNGVPDDVVTSGDKFAQALYERELKRKFPNFGLIGEENGLRVPCSIKDHDVYFTIDPLDGTKAYKRGQSHGVGTMIALVFDGEVIIAYIGDINTGEIFGFDATIDEPGLGHRIRFGIDSFLSPNLRDPLHNQYVYTRRNPRFEVDWVQTLLAPKDFGGFFRDIEVGGGSVGIAIARLWKGEIGASLLEAGNTTPWDEAPVVGISTWLGYEFYIINPNPTKEREIFIPRENILIKDVCKNPHSCLIVHHGHREELCAWIETNKEVFFKG